MDERRKLLIAIEGLTEKKTRGRPQATSAQMAAFPSPIVGVLLEENTRLERVLKELGAIPGRVGRPPKHAAHLESTPPTPATADRPKGPGRRRWTAAQRKAAAARMKNRWAAKQALAPAKAGKARG